MINLQPFCAGPDELRYYLQNPWRQDGRIFATNGHIMIAIDDDGRECGEAPNDAVQRSCLRYVSQLADTYLPIDKFPLPPVEPCPSCVAGKVMANIIEPCRECDGSGDTQCDMGHDHDCPDCNGTGDIETGEKAEDDCADCSGTGENAVQAVRVFGAHVNRKYLALIAALPDAEIGIMDVSDKPIPFRFTGGNGVVMGLRV